MGREVAQIGERTARAVATQVYGLVQGCESGTVAPRCGSKIEAHFAIIVAREIRVVDVEIELIAAYIH